MEKITSMLEKKFTVSVEIVPPRNGTSREEILRLLAKVKELGVDFLSVTKGAGGSLRGGTMPLTHFASEKFGLPSIAHFTCRELTKNEAENFLVDTYYFGIKNILALRGDAPDYVDEAGTVGEFTYAYELVKQISDANKGLYRTRQGLDEGKTCREGTPTDFCIGVAAHLEEGEGVAHLQKKVEEGADFAITQMIFDATLYARFVRECREAGVKIPILPGIWPLDKKWKLDAALNKFKASIPSAIVEQLRATSDKEAFRNIGIAFTSKLCKELRAAGAPGVHLFIMQDTQVAKDILQGMRKAYTSAKREP